MGSCQSGLATSHTLAQVPQSADKSAQPTGSPQSTMPTGSAQSQDVQVPRILKKTVSLSREPPKAQTHLLADDKTKHVAIGMLGASSSKKFKPVLPQIPAAPTRKATVSMLINAAEQGRTSLVRRYLEDGADASATSKDGDTLAIFAAGVGNVPMLVYILELSPELAVKPNEGGLQPLHAAAMQGFSDAVEVLLESGASPDPDLRYGDTNGPVCAMELALQYGHMKVARILLEHGANTAFIRDLDLLEKLGPLLPQPPPTPTSLSCNPSSKSSPTSSLTSVPSGDRDGTPSHGQRPNPATPKHQPLADQTHRQPEPEPPAWQPPPQPARTVWEPPPQQHTQQSFLPPLRQARPIVKTPPAPPAPPARTSKLASFTACACGHPSAPAYVALPCCHQLCPECIRQSLASGRPSQSEVEAWQAAQMGQNRVAALNGALHLRACPACWAAGDSGGVQEEEGELVLVISKQ